jgi:UDP-hydrolysing UDP-N-acetyl-D-glucosamine 2-epimerase
MSSNMLKIIAFTSIRSEYDLMSSLYRRLSQDENIDFKLIVSGAHLVTTLGRSVVEIENDGFEIGYRIESLLASDSKVSRVKSAAILQSACIDILSNESPDLVIFAGDREDVLVYAIVCAFLDIPSAHFFGGDHAKDGHVDNPVRHATSKLASLHFVSTEEHRHRLLAIGESDRRIYVIGSVALDKFLSEPIINKVEVQKSLGISEIAKRKKMAILIFHPIDSEREFANSYLQNIVKVLNQHGYYICASMPNSDPGNTTIRETLVKLSKYSNIMVYENLPRTLFINLLRISDLIIGNSSAGLLEAPSIPVPAINVGERQKGRFASSNVVFSGGSVEDITNSVLLVESDEFRAKLYSTPNPYGDGQSVERAFKLINELNLSSYVRKPEDPLEN